MRTLVLHKDSIALIPCMGANAFAFCTTDFPNVLFVNNKYRGFEFSNFSLLLPDHLAFIEFLLY